VIAVLVARRSGATVNAAAKAAGINYRTAQRIAEAAEERRQTDLVAAQLKRDLDQLAASRQCVVRVRADHDTSTTVPIR
jgi:molybdenum-dependent DNA-binding transcriptional regulator ModE